MNENILIESKHINGKKFLSFCFIIGFIISAILLISDCMTASQYDQECYNTYSDHQANNQCNHFKCSSCEHVETYPTFGSYLSATVFSSPTFLIPVVAITCWGFLMYAMFKSYRLVVTDKRVYGTILWGLKRVDLPLDSVAATSMVKFFNIIGVTTSSGTIRFSFIANADDVYLTISNLLIERQEKKRATALS